ncbi:MAG: UDP-N-acetylmuramoyl-L-alanine--D-glutamate ligase [Gammaproteobacteria bacterium]|nr:UDP-N-acetylmuramoyl-L-alanine--D-glutamate ligase [Gammaproteobacteria bacterium]
MRINTKKQKYVLVVGLGMTGCSALRFFTEQKIPVIGFDTRMVLPAMDQIEEKWPEVPIYLKNIPEDVLEVVSELVVSPGVPLNTPIIQQAKARGIPVIGDIEVFARSTEVPIIAITGSNGKSTVTTLVTKMLNAMGKKAVLAGNIGIPVLDLFQGEDCPDYVVLELSSFQLELTYSLMPEVAAMLNISPDHLDRHGTFTAYQAAKERIFRGAKKMVLHRQTQYQTNFAGLEDDLTTFGLDQALPGHFGLIETDQKTILAFGDRPLIASDEIHLSARHQLENALAALSIVKAVAQGYSKTDCGGHDCDHSAQEGFKAALQVLREFEGLPHRCRLVKEDQGIRWINDSKATNIGAAAAAIEGLGKGHAGRILLIAGGQGKGADFREMIPCVQKYVSDVFLLGQDASLIETAWQGVTHLHRVKNLEEAVAKARALAKSGDIVLLAPACASLDMFDDYEHRGAVFEALVSV